MRILLKYVRVMDAVSEFFGRAASFLVLLTLAVGFGNVIARYLGRFVGQQFSSNRWIETQWYLFSLVFFLMFPYILKHNVNVRVDFLYAKWTRKRQTVVDLMGTLVFLVPFCILGIYVTITPVLFSWGQLTDGSWGPWELSPDPDGLPRALIKSMIIIAFATLLLQAIAQIIKYIAVLTGYTEVERDLEEDSQGQAPVAS